jgi:hypothetical protein
MWPALPRRSPRELAALVEAAACLGLARLTVHLVPLSALSPHLGRHMAETGPAIAPAERPAALRVGWAIAAAARRLPWRCMCLEQALAARLMLRRRGLPSTLYLGASRGAEAMQAHAWLRSGELILTGAAERERFVVVSSFAEP